MAKRKQGLLSGDFLHSLEQRLLFAFGLTTSSSLYTVDTGAQLTFSVSRTAGSGSVGDLTTMNYSGTALLAPFSTSDRYSHYESGLSSATVVTATVDPNNQWILISCNDTGSTGVGVIQYYLARKGYNNIYMASYSPGPNSPSPGEMRFITYTSPTLLTNIPAPSNNNGNTGAIESSDVFGHADGTTTSKYYGEYRAIDNQTYGVTGGGFGVYMNIGNRETSSGGPFFKDIDFQNNELYTYTFSGHSQTEAFRPGLKGFYALEATTGANPGAPDYTFIDSLGVGPYITGYTGASGRGSVTGIASGVPSTLQETVAISNAADQYWALPNTTTGQYTITGVLPGTYTETIYQGELAAGTQTVTVTAGQSTAVNINDTLYTPSAANTIFRIGTWDGTPLGFLNSNLITNMHPTDIRMSPWAADATGVTNFIVGTDPDSSFPMAEWHTQNTTTPYVDTDNRITFTLTAAQAATALTFRIGLTRLDSARPNITVNSNYSTAVQSIATEPDSRGLTTGNWRGNNVTYSFNLPTTSLHAGTNTIDIYSVSGSTGTLYSGYHIYDALDLVTTASITNPPVVKTLTIAPANATFPVNGRYTYTVQAYDQNGNAIASNSTWSTTSGTIDNAGNYIAPASASTGTITATVGSVTATTNVTTVVGSPPTVATPAAGSPNPVTGTTTTLSVLGADDGGESNLTYTWSATGPAAVVFSANSTNAAKSSVATFTLPGTYQFTVTIKDAQNLFVTSSTTVVVNQTFTSIASTGANMAAGTIEQITPLDQFGTAMPATGYTWSASVGMISAAGLYTAPLNAPSNGTTSASITGTLNGISKSTTVVIVGPLAWYQADQSAGPSLTDSSGNNYTASLTGAYNFSTGVIGNALHVTGGYGMVPAGILSTTSDFTIAAWIKPDSLSNWMRIFDFGTGQTKYMFLTPDAGTSNALRFSITTSGGTGEQQLNGPAITAGVWTHVAVTLIGSTGTLYVNGVAVATNTAMTLHPSSLGSTTLNYLGKSQFSDPAYQGSIDDFRIFTTGLSAGAVASLYNTTYHTPSVAVAAAASPASTTGTSTALSVLGSEQAGESNLTYTWTATGPAAVGFSVNGTNAAKNTTAVFTQSGVYNFVVTITDPIGESTTSSVQVTVVPTTYTGTTGADAYAIRVSPTDATMEQIFVNTAETGSPTYTVAISQLSSLTFNTAGDGSLIVDFSNGDPIPTGGISFTGGNRLQVEGVSTGGLYFSVGAGQIVDAAAPSSPINYSNVANLEFDLMGGSNTLTQLAQPAASLTYNAGSGSNTLNVTAGNFTFTTDPAVASGALTVNDYSSVVFTPVVNTYAPINLAGLNLFGSATATVSASASTTGRTVLETGLLSVAQGAVVDLTNNAMIVHNGNLSAINGVISSTAATDPAHLTTLGIISNNNSGAAYYTSFDNQPAVPTDVLIKYTYFGDTNLDGKVDGSDYSRIDSGFLNQSTGWFNGDFNGDGVINGSDYTLIDNAFNRQGAVLASQVATSPKQGPVRSTAVFSTTTIVASAEDEKRRHRVIDLIEN